MSLYKIYTEYMRIFQIFIFLIFRVSHNYKDQKNIVMINTLYLIKIIKKNSKLDFTLRIIQYKTF